MYLFILALLLLVISILVIFKCSNSSPSAEKKTFNIKDFEYVPIDYESCVRMAKQTKKKLGEFGLNNSVLYEKIDRILDSLPKILQHANKCCCRQVKANGYFSVVKLNYKFFELIYTQFSLQKNQKDFREDLETFNILCDLFLKIIDEIMLLIHYTDLDNEQVLLNFENELNKYAEFHRALPVYRKVVEVYEQITDNQTEKNSRTINNNVLNTLHTSSVKNQNTENDSSHNKPINQKFESLPLFMINLSTMSRMFYETFFELKQKETSFRKYFMFFVDPKTAFLVRMYKNLILFARAHLYDYPRLLFSAKFRSSYLNKIISYPTINFPIETWHLDASKVAQFIHYLQTLHLNVKTNELLLPTQDSIEITTTYRNRLKIHNPDKIEFNTNRKIRCKLLVPENLSLQDCDDLLIQIHGGGYLALSYNSAHIIYSKYWVNRNRIPSLIIDFRVKEPFPNSLKDCLDVYLWIATASQNEIRSVLGYYPRKIVVAGESSGGTWAMSLALILNDLRRDYKDKLNFEIRVPDGLFLIYPPLMLQNCLSPSKAFCILDVMTPSAIQLIILDALKGRIQNLRLNNWLENLKMILFPSTDPKPWFHNSTRQQFIDRMESFSKDENSPYLSPLLYDKFDDFDDILLTVMTSEFDIFLDESITLAKLYKGRTKVDVFADQCHGFLAFEYGTDKFKSLSADRLAEMFREIK